MTLEARWEPEVAQALSSGKAVVALESSVIAQGLPLPHNLEAAARCEAAVRAQGAIPATLALIDGEIRVGLGRSGLERLANPARGETCLKLGIRDLGWAMARRATGGTTVSATAALAHRAGIRVFSTGGIGGVHRGDDFDVSSDLIALSQHPVAVVCAGAKIILDLPRTLEVLETLGVPVVGLGTRELPGFTCRTSGLPLEQGADDAQALARICQAHWSLSDTSVLCVQPCPARSALPREEMEAAIARGLDLAKQQGVHGKATTPFLLRHVADATRGRSIAANLDLLEANAALGGQLAVALSSLPSVGG
jgi:pseudouridine-5'-phosphate glycosidase